MNGAGLRLEIFRTRLEHRCATRQRVKRSEENLSKVTRPSQSLDMDSLMPNRCPIKWFPSRHLETLEKWSESNKKGNGDVIDGKDYDLHGDRVMVCLEASDFSYSCTGHISFGGHLRLWTKSYAVASLPRQPCGLPLGQHMLGLHLVILLHKVSYIDGYQVFSKKGWEDPLI